MRSDDAKVTRLKVQDEDFLVASMIERCPRTMMIRELLQNALEAAATAPAGQRRVEFSALPVEGARKLAIWNSGRGLTGPELFAMCDIAASIRKETGLDRNFGMGAKVAALPSNPRGLRYRSAHQGAVQEVVIGRFGGVYGRLRRPGPDGSPTEVIPATEAARAEGRDPVPDWTEAVLLGQAPAQDTTADPYLGQPRVSPRWLPHTITHRFFRFPDGIEVVLQPGVAGNKAPVALQSLAARLAALTQEAGAGYEAVRLPDGTVLHYAFDPEASLAEARKSLGAVVHRDEIYGLLWAAAWRREAPSFGIPFLSRHVTLLVELPETYPVQPEAYREFLRYRGGSQAQVKLLDFAGLLAKHLPRWLSKKLAEAQPEALYAEEARQTMQELLERLEVARMRPRGQPVVAAAAPAAPASKPSAPSATPAAARAATEAASPPGPPPGPAFEVPPALVLLRDAQEIADRDLTERAAAYYAETHQLHVNLAYPAVALLAERLRALAPPEAEPEVVAEAAQLVAERAMVLRLVRALAHGLAKRGQKAWRDAQVKHVLSPEGLTLAADDNETGWLDSEQAMRTALLMAPAN
ncbi:ATP-binding protein [Pseudoroseomonas deserti]|uniref:ATP-binding protein n=1 Tax=Teichococcus deserti TaxID=1817963 RepID=A0A1V2GZ43_9PROT|nr:ATP-binding protein [Pseudoroseomonas deserti]ONG50454.1 ATP-binding protein [Pseudoroseomonas deserti]